jgi:hypothetical protein
MPPYSQLHFTVAVDCDEAAGDSPRLFRVSLPRAPKWERALAGDVLRLLSTRVLAANSRGGDRRAHLATARGPIGNDEPLRAHGASCWLGAAVAQTPRGPSGSEQPVDLSCCTHAVLALRSISFRGG